MCNNPNRNIVNSSCSSERVKEQCEKELQKSIYISPLKFLKSLTEL